MAGILERINTILRANINDMIDRAEDPEKMIDQYIRDMEDTITKAREQVAESMASEKKLNRDIDTSLRHAGDYENRAATALRRGDETLAREAMTRKLDADKATDALRQQLDEQTREVAQLRAQMGDLQAKYEEAKRSRDVLVARGKRIRAEREARGGSLAADQAAFANFDRMKDKIEHDLDVLESSRQLAEERSADAQFSQLDADAEVDQALEQLKRRLSGGTATSTTASGS